MKYIYLQLLLLSALISFPTMLQGYETRTETIFTENNRSRIKFIYFSLVNTHEYQSHNLGDDTNNKVYTHKDGHVEAVYDKITGELVTDCLNKGNFNFFPAHISPLEHFSADILPWINFGNCPDDPSTKKERAEAFSKDFIDGCFSIIMNWNKFKEEDDIKEMQIREKGQSKTLKIFLNILTSKDFENYKFDGTDPWMKDQEKYDLFHATLKHKIIDALIR